MTIVEKALLDHAPEAVFWTREDGSFAYVNKTACRSLGFSREELLQRSIFEIDPDLTLEFWKSHWSNVARNEIVTLHRFHLRRDGSLIPVEVQVQQIAVDDELVHFSYARDLTEEQKTEAQRQSHLSYLNTLFEESPVPQLIIDPETGSIVEANPAAAAFYAYDADALCLMTIQQINLMPDDDVRREMQRARDHECSFFRFQHTDARNQVHHVHVFSVPILRGGEQVLHSSIIDVTEIIESRQRLVQYKALVERLPIGVYQATPGADGVILSGNSALCRIFDLETEQQIIGRKVADFYADPEERAELSQQVLKAGRVSREKRRAVTTTGRAIWIAITSQATELASGNTVLEGAVEDITERRRHEQRMRQAEAIIQSAHEGITITDPDRNIERVNAAFTRITGYSEAEVCGRNPRILSSGRQDKAFYEQMWSQIHEHGEWQGEIWNRRKNGEIYPEWLSVTTIRNKAGEVANYAGVFSDLTELKRSQFDLEQSQYFDPLTALPNRRMLSRMLANTLDKARANAGHAAVLVCGLDRFRIINESYSYLAGDRILKAVSERLDEILDRHTEVARHGSDQFAFVIRSGAGESTVLDLIDRLASTFKKTLEVDKNQHINVQFTTGIALFPRDGDTPEELLRNAETAMFHAKRASRGTYAFFSPNHTESAKKTLVLETRMRQAIDDDAFEVHFQPLVSVTDNTIVGAEALARWPGSKQDPVSPDVFIPLAEQSGLIDRLSFQLLEKACRATGALQQEFAKDLHLAFNISALQLSDKRFVKKIVDCLARNELDPRHFELELTESTLMEQASGSARVLKRLRGLGIRISIDDFGTGFSSLAYLQEIDAQILKIDRRFIRNVPTRQSDSRIAASIIAMAHALDMDVVAEGVETSEQLEFLRQNQCDFYQGYLFSKPLPLEKFGQMYRAHA